MSTFKKESWRVNTPVFRYYIDNTRSTLGALTNVNQLILQAGFPAIGAS